MKKIQKITSIPLLTALLLLQGVNIPTADVREDEVEHILSVLVSNEGEGQAGSVNRS